MNLPLHPKILAFASFCWLSTNLLAQERAFKPEVIITEDKKFENVFNFKLRNTPALKQISGAPKAHYSYFWEFGDGSYSTEESPTHTYGDKKKGKVKVSLTNNYGSGGAPKLGTKSRENFQRTNQLDAQKEKWKKKENKSYPLASNESIHLFNNHSPRPGDELVSVLSYQNTSNDLQPMGGTIYLFYNEKAYQYDNFEFKESRYHKGENFTQGLRQGNLSASKIVGNSDLRSSTNSEAVIVNPFFLTQETGNDYWQFMPQYIPGGKSDKALSNAKKTYNNVLSWRFDNLAKGEKRNIFTSLETTANMVTDTTATITYKGIMVPDFKDNPKEFSLKMTVQSSHDPNKMFVSHKEIRKRSIKSNGITYTVKFQNVGRGAAGNILIENTLADALDPSSIKISKIYPNANICLAGDSAFTESCLDTTRIGQLVKWQFKNVYLPGTRQKDRENRRATKGFIEFTVKTKDKFKKKQTLGTRAYIYFDRNDPVKTNKVKTEILKSTSWGIKGGFSNIGENDDDIFVALTTSPFKPRGIYYQPEFGFSRLSYFSVNDTFSGILFTNANGASFTGTTINKSEILSTYFDVIPLQFRTNIASFLSVGAGFQFSFLLKARDRSFTSIVFDDVSGKPPFPAQIDEFETVIYDWPNQKDDRLTGLETGYFFDISLGLVKKGPSLGIRYQQRKSKRLQNRQDGLSENQKYLQLYATYKF